MATHTWHVLQINAEFDKILQAKTGDPNTPFNLTEAASKKVADAMNVGIQCVP